MSYDLATQAAHHADISKYDLQGEEQVMYYGNMAYVPRLVQANIPWQRPPMAGIRYSTKKGGGLKSLGAETYAPSGMPLKVGDLALPGRKSATASTEPLAPLVEAKRAK